MLAEAQRATVDDGFILTEAKAQKVMESFHSERLRYVEFDAGLTVAVLEGGLYRIYDEAGRLLH